MQDINAKRNMINIKAVRGRKGIDRDLYARQPAGY